MSVRRGARSTCPIGATLDILGDRWSLLVLRDILIRGKRRYGEFLVGEEAIATNVLADRLARLEECGVISKARDADDRRQFLYAPTERGLDLLPVLFQLTRWGLKHVAGTEIPKPYRHRLGDPGALEREIRTKFRRSLRSSPARS